jgi:hypothetical protein
LSNKTNRFLRERAAENLSGASERIKEKLKTWTSRNSFEDDGDEVLPTERPKVIPLPEEPEATPEEAKAKADAEQVEKVIVENKENKVDNSRSKEKS